MRARSNPDVRLIRQRLGFTQADLADQIAMRMNAVWAWEHGRPMSRLARSVFLAWLRQPHIVAKLAAVMTPEEVLAALGEPVSDTPGHHSLPS